MSRSLRVVVLGASAVLLLSGLGSTDLWAPDEPRYGQVAEELRAADHGVADRVLLHLNGEVYTQKPPLYFWLAALAGAPSGRVTEIAARLPSALSGLLCIGLMLHFGTRLLGAPTGLLSAALLLTVYDFARHARRAQLDVMLCLFETVALYAFWQIDRGSPHRKRDLAILHTAMGLAVLTKGPVGLLVPLLVIFITLLWERRPGDIRRLLPVWALPLSLGPGLAWIASAAFLAPDGYLSEAVGSNLFGRFFGGNAHARPFYYYLYQFPVNFLPWTLLWPAVLWVGRGRIFGDGADPERARTWRFLLSWIAASLIFFTLSSGKRGLYLLPAFPAVALLCADALGSLVSAARSLPGWIPTGLLALCAGVGLGGAGVAFVPESAVGVAIPAAFGASLSAIALAGFAAWRLSGRHPGREWIRIGTVLGAVFAIEFVVFALLFPALDPLKSPRPVATAAAALVADGAPVGVLGRRSLVGGLLYYGGRQVAELDDPGALERFRAEGGRVIVVTQRRLAELATNAAIEIESWSRRGARRLYVVTIAEAAAEAAQP